MKDITKEEFSKLHHELVQKVADFLKDKKLTERAWMFTLTIDSLDALKEFGEWTGYNDSYMSITNTAREELIWGM